MRMFLRWRISISPFTSIGCVDDFSAAILVLRHAQDTVCSSFLFLANFQAHHFFKAGQRRADAKVALRSLSAQLAERLPGMAAALASEIDKLQAASDADGPSTMEQLTWLQLHET